MSEDAKWIWLQLVFGFGSRRGHLMLEYFGSGPQVWEESQPGGRAALMMSSQELHNSDAAMERALHIEASCYKKSCKVLTPGSGEYPKILEHIYARPAVLYAKGSLSCLDDRLTIAMVGTRKASPYGAKAATEIAAGLAREGVVIVSGLAHGIDTESHRSALNAGGVTIGVMGCGLDIDYPRGNAPLKTAMVEQGGAVITEYPFGISVRPAFFPLRNRIISGLCQGTVVVEAGLKSGALITAQHAAEQGRDVFAVPGDIFSGEHQGANHIISDGAKPVACAKDILEEYPLFYHGEDISDTPQANNPSKSGATINSAAAKPRPLPDGLSSEAMEAYRAISGETFTADDIASISGLAIVESLTALTELELFGLIESLPGRRFTLK